MKAFFSKSCPEALNILVVGNNPIEMSSILQKLQQVRKRRIVTETAFDIRSTLERLVHFTPNFIFIDDNLGQLELKGTVDTLSSFRKTKNVPITILKNSNYREILPLPGILDYLLKQNLSPDSLYGTLKNSARLRKTQRLLMKVYKRKTRWLTGFAKQKSESNLIQ